MDRVAPSSALAWSNDDLKHECAIFLAYRRPGLGPDAGLEASVLPTALQGLRSQSNRGQEGYGLASFNPGLDQAFRMYRSGESIEHLSRLSADELTERFGSFEATAIIGHNRYATHGLPDESNCQPMANDQATLLSPYRRKAIAFNGHIANADELRQELADKGIDFRGTTDTEVLLHLIADIDDASSGLPSDYAAIFRELDRRIDGACSLVLIDAGGDAALYRNRSGIRPLEFLESDDGVLIAASETEAFRGIPGQHRTVKAGELLWYKRNEDSWTIARIAEPDPHFCILELLYFGRANSLYRGYSHYRVRRDIGALMAEDERDRVAQMSADERGRVRVVPVPNTAIPFAIGLSNALDLPYEMGIERRESTRAFINSERDRRLKILGRKFAVLDEVVSGNNIWVVDDTLIRRETSETITKLLRAAGARTIEWLICAPPFQGTCYYGIAVPSVDELAYWQAATALSGPFRERALRGEALLQVEQQIAKDIGADRVKFLPMDRMLKVLPGPADSYCQGCFKGRYPTPAGTRNFEASLAQFLSEKSDGRTQSAEEVLS